MSVTGIPELKESYRALGGARFTVLMLGLLAWVGLQVWLTEALDYPRAYGSTCHRKCMIENYWYSAALIKHGSIASFALFAMLWSLPALVVGALIFSRLKKRRDPLSNKILSE